MRGAALLLLALTLAAPAGAQTAPGPAQTQAAAPAPAPPETAATCREPGGDGPSAPSLPNLAAAIRKDNKAVILVVGSSGAASRKGRHGDGYFGLVRRYLERNFKGLELTIAHRGAPGALARDAAETIRVEAALTGANLVLWQVGTADAMARISPQEFRADLETTLDWLKAHGIDVMLVGLHYSDAMRKDTHYQQIREALRAVAQDKGAPRIRRYEAAETLARMRAATDETPAPDCMADWLAQAVAVGLFGRRTPQETGAPPPR
ncbi:MAG: SGNH/GDSL hydrolase family protein [Methylobacteriaceae bacterium]|nr:SGNH/GDSL hydrolase family protein [Methylobacteriaceae bacterium]